MEVIKTDLLKEEYFKLEAKLQAIDKIPRLYGTGVDFESINIEDDGVSYNTYTSYSGCGNDYFHLSLKWDEINKPLEYFEQKFIKDIEADKARKSVKELADKKVKEERELAEFERLKLKFSAERS